MKNLKEYSAYSEIETKISGAPRLVVTGDLHMGRYRQSALRDYLFGTLNQLLDLTTKYSPELILITGDIFRSKHPSVAALTQTGTLLAQVAQVAPVVLIAGNHDITSSTVTTIDVYSNYPNITVVTKPRILTYDRFQICAVPWLPQKALIAMGDGTESTAGAINFLMQLLTNQMDEDKFSILLAHATALGTDYHDGASSTLGSDVLWPNDWFREFDVCFLGHIHKPQTVPGTTNAFYVGSPCPISFNEAGQRKSVILYDDGAVTRIPTRHPHFASVRADELSGETDYSNTFLRITKKHGDPDPDVPDCLWHEIISMPPERELRRRMAESPRLDIAAALRQWLEDNGHMDKLEQVEELMREIEDA